MQQAFPVVVMRGGTSRGLFFHDSDLPTEKEARDHVFQAALGSPDPYGRQIDGLGGATSSTSKAVTVRKSNRVDADIDYTFTQVGVKEPIVDYSGNCGNLSAAVGPFAIDEGLLAVDETTATVRLFNTNTQKLIEASFSVTNGRACTEGDYSIDGVPGTAAPIALTYQDPGGAVTGNLLPTGQTCNTIDVEGLGDVTVSIVDAANPVVFVDAHRLRRTGAELPDQLNGEPALLAQMEQIRLEVARLLDLGPIQSLRVAMVAPSMEYETTQGSVVPKQAVTFLGRIVSLGRFHHAFTLTGAISAAVAANIPGSVVNEAACATAEKLDLVRLGHPAGAIDIQAKMDTSAASPRVEHVTTFRTARRIMDGTIYVPNLSKTATQAEGSIG